MKKVILSALVFLVMKIRKNIQSRYQKIFCEDKHVDLLLTGEEAKGTMFLSEILIHSCMIKLYIVEKKHFSRYCLDVFRTAEKLKCCIKDCFKINDKQRIKMSKKVTTSDSKIMKEK